MKKIALILAAASFALVSCGQPAAQPAPVIYGEEVEDCDAEDMVEGDSDCYGVDLKRSKKHKKIGYDKTGRPIYQKKSSRSYSSSRSSSRSSGYSSSSSRSSSSSGRRR
jgi:hypothetical protein